MALVLLLPPAPSTAQQQGPGTEEARRLQEAAALEAAGELERAGALLGEILDRNPGSGVGLLALERVMRLQGRLSAFLPRVEAAVRADPVSAEWHFLRLRITAEVGRSELLPVAVEEWVAAFPNSADPYREGARLHQVAGDIPGARTLLERGEGRLGEGAGLGLELGDLLLRQGDTTGAVAAWGRAAGGDPAHLGGVLRRVEELRPGDRARHLAGVVARLSSPPTSPERLRTGARLAVEVRLEGEAVELAGRAVREMDPPSRREFLLSLAGDAEATGAGAVTVWALQALRSEAGAVDPDRARAVDQQLAGAAAARGDSAAAAAAYRRLAESAPRGSGERRRALASALRLEAGGRDAGAIRRGLEDFREEFPGAPELDDLVAHLSRSLQDRGDEAGARALVVGMEGPGAARERAYMALGGEDPRVAREDLMAALAGASPAAATELLGLIGLLDTLGESGARLAAGAAVRLNAGDPGGAAALVEEGIPAVDADDLPPLLALAARSRELAGNADEAARLRARLLAEHPGALQAPEAALALARHRARTPGQVTEAIEILETLIVTRPNHPVVPAARRELQRLRGMAATGTGGLDR